MDLKGLDTTKLADEGVSLTLKHPATGADLKDGDQPVQITVVGQDSKRYRDAQAKTSEKRLSSVLARGRRAKLSAAEVETDSLDLLVTCTIGFKNISLDKKPLECTPDNVRKLYTQFAWIREQVDEFINDRSNFLGN